MANSHPGPGTTETDLAHDRGSFRALVAKPGRSKGPGARVSLDGVVAGNCPPTLRQCRPPPLLYLLLPRGTISSAGNRRFDQVMPERIGDVEIHLHHDQDTEEQFSTAWVCS